MSKKIKITIAAMLITFNAMSISTILGRANALATTFGVSASAADNDSNSGDGCSLREALRASAENSNSSDCGVQGSATEEDIISIPEGTINISSDLPIYGGSTGPITIKGVNKNSSIVNFQSNSGIKYESNSDVWVKDVQFKDANTLTPSSGSLQNLTTNDSGMAFFGVEILLDNVIYTGGKNRLILRNSLNGSTSVEPIKISNSSISNSVGGVFIEPQSDFYLENSKVNGNTGGFYFYSNDYAAGVAYSGQGTGKVEITNSEVSDNQASGIAGFFGANARGVIVKNSTFANNSTNRDSKANNISVSGFAISSSSTAEEYYSSMDNIEVLFENNTVSGNKSVISAQKVSGDMGGHSGVYLASDFNERIAPKLVNNTIVDNSIEDNTVSNLSQDQEENLGLSSGFAGGSSVDANLNDIGPAEAQNNLLANNLINEDLSSCSTKFSGQVLPVPKSLGGNLVDDDSCSTEFTKEKDQVKLSGLAGSLEALTDNGGPTRTRALKASSPAVNSGVPNALVADQRGLIRPYGSAIDSGSYEYKPSEQTSTNPESGDGSGGSGNSIVKPPKTGLVYAGIILVALVTVILFTAIFTIKNLSLNKNRSER